MRLKIHWSLSLRIWFRSWLTLSIRIKSWSPSRKKLLRSWRLGWALTNLVWIDRDLTSNHPVQVNCPYQEGRRILCKVWIWWWWDRSEASLTFSWMGSRLNWAKTDSAKIHWSRFNIKTSPLLLTKCQGILRMILSDLIWFRIKTTLHRFVVSNHHLQINKIHWFKIMKNNNLSSRMTPWANLNKTRRLVKQNSHCNCHVIRETTHPN